MSLKSSSPFEPPSLFSLLQESSSLKGTTGLFFSTQSRVGTRNGTMKGRRRRLSGSPGYKWVAKEEEKEEKEEGNERSEGGAGVMDTLSVSPYRCTDSSLAGHYARGRQDDAYPRVLPHDVSQPIQTSDQYAASFAAKHTRVWKNMERAAIENVMLAHNRVFSFEYHSPATDADYTLACATISRNEKFIVLTLKMFSHMCASSRTPDHWKFCGILWTEFIFFVHFLPMPQKGFFSFSALDLPYFSSILSFMTA